MWALGCFGASSATGQFTFSLMSLEEFAGKSAIFMLNTTIPLMKGVEWFFCFLAIINVLGKALIVQCDTGDQKRN